MWTAFIPNLHFQILLEHGADVDAEEEDDWTPLHMAASYGHTKTVRVSIRILRTYLSQRFVPQTLLDHGADVNAEEEDDWTALHMASRYGHTKTVQANTLGSLSCVRGIWTFRHFSNMGPMSTSERTMDGCHSIWHPVLVIHRLFKSVWRLLCTPA